MAEVMDWESKFYEKLDDTNLKEVLPMTVRESDLLSAGLKIFAQNSIDQATSAVKVAVPFAYNFQTELDRWEEERLKAMDTITIPGSVAMLTGTEGLDT